MEMSIKYKTYVALHNLMSGNSYLSTNFVTTNAFRKKKGVKSIVYIVIECHCDNSFNQSVFWKN